MRRCAKTIISTCLRGAALCVDTLRLHADFMPSRDASVLAGSSLQRRSSRCQWAAAVCSSLARRSWLHHPGLPARCAGYSFKNPPRSPLLLLNSTAAVPCLQAGVVSASEAEDDEARVTVFTAK